MLFSVENVRFSYGGNLIFDDLSLIMHEGEKVALVGENGVGKTTLLKLITGALFPDGGRVVLKNGVKIGYAEQNGGYESGNTVIEEMRGALKEQFDAVERLQELSTKLSELPYASAEYSKLSVKIEALNKFISSHDCYNAEVKIRTVLGGMGFDGAFSQVIDTMSGGEKTRLKLARLLLEEPDLLILDEPTNHLDLKTLGWLETYLSTYKGAVFVVSHDRYFLDKVAERVAEIENGRLYTYSGNYTKYKRLKADRIEREMKEYLAQREEIAKLQDYVDRNIVRATTAKSAQSRVKQLEKMEILEKPFTPPSPPKFKFTYTQQPAEEVLNISGFDLSAGEKVLVKNLCLTLRRGQKLAIVGENGTGKSTLLRAVTAGGTPQIKLGRHVNIAYYDQEMANLNPENTVLEELWGRHVVSSQTEVRSSLARCGLFAEDMDKKVKSLSGGERAKLALCVFENACGNVLILDEPTNHLDLPARESLEEALKSFDGTVVFVSHDRYFISAVCDCVAEIEDGKLTLYNEGFEGYTAQKEAAAQVKKREEEERARAEWKQQSESSYRSKKDRAEAAKKSAAIKAVEADISACERRESELNTQLADPSVASDFTKLSPILKELEEVRKKLEKLYDDYGGLIE